MLRSIVARLERVAEVVVRRWSGGGLDIGCGFNCRRLSENEPGAAAKFLLLASRDAVLRCCSMDDCCSMVVLPELESRVGTAAEEVEDDAVRMLG